jgi:DNA-binding beta-propeller fold protein YncE
VRVRRPLAIAVLALGLGLAGCGDDGAERAASAEPDVPYPPTAAEPAAAPVASARPAGRVVRVGPGPEGLAFDPQTGLVAVGLREPAALALVDGRSGALRRRVALPGAPRHLELARPGGPVLVPAEGADALVEVSLPEGESRVTRVGDQPHDAAFLDGRAYAIDELGSTLSVVEQGRLVRRAPVDVQPGGVVALDDRLAVISVQAYTIELFDPRSLRGQGSRNAGLGPTHVVADEDGRLHVADTRGGALVTFETRPRLRWISRLPLPGSPYGLAIDRERDRLWVTLVGRNELVEVAAGDAPRRLRALPTVRQPNSVAVDPRTGRVAVASRTDGTVQLVDP